MTGGQKSTRERVGAVFFAVVMVVSMVAIGGFAGTAAAQSAGTGGIDSTDTQFAAGDTIEFSQDTTSVDTSDGSTGVTAEFTMPSQIDLSGASVTNVDVTSSDTDPSDSPITSGVNGQVITVTFDDPSSGGATSSNLDIELDVENIGISSPGSGDITYVADVNGDDSNEITGTNTVGTLQAFENDDSANPPSITSVTKTGAQELTVEFSEGISDAGDTSVEDGDFTYVDNNAGGATAVDGGQSHTVGDDTLTLTTDNVITSSDVGSDAIFATTAIKDVDDNDATQNTVTIQEPLAGDSNGEISTEIDGTDTQNLRAGSTGQSLGLIQVKDISGGNSPLAQRTILRMPDGVTINETDTDLVVTTTSGNLEVTGTEVVDESTLRIDHSGSSDCCVE